MSIYDDLPKLNMNNHKITSIRDRTYNCIAWAAGDTSRWWSHHVGYYWPVERSSKIDSLIAVFESVGYHRDDAACETNSDTEVIALFARNNEWKHAAKRLPNGKWSSKCGVFEDIEHDDLETLAGDLYGMVYCFMVRPQQ